VVRGAIEGVLSGDPDALSAEQGVTPDARESGQRLRGAVLPAEFRQVCQGLHQVLVDWQAALRDDDLARLMAADGPLLAGFGALRTLVESRSLRNLPLSDAQRLELISQLLFGQPLDALQGEACAVMTAFENVQLLANPDGSFGAPLRVLTERMAHFDAAFDTPEMRTLLLQLLEIDLWGARDAEHLAADIAREMGYATRQVDTLGAGAMGRVVHLRGGASERMRLSVQLGPHEELVAKLPTNSQQLGAEVDASFRAAAVGAGPRCVPSSRAGIALFMVYERGARELTQVMRERPFDLRLVRQLALQLQSLHERAGLVHRDIKPANVLVCEADDRCLVIDYGLAENVPAAGRGCDQDVIKGSLSFLPPEGILQQEWGVRTDLYALGATMFEWCTGRSWLTHLQQTVAMPGTGLASIYEAHRRFDSEALRQALEVVADPDVRWLLSQLLQPEPQSRVASAAELAQLCQLVLDRQAGA
jgi:hypothetical protein